MTIALDTRPPDVDDTDLLGATLARRSPVRAPMRLAREVVLVLGLYWAYSFVRGRFGSASVGADHAAANARTIIGIERTLGIANESQLQHWFLQWPDIVWLANVFYGLVHFIAPVATLLFLFRRGFDTYRRGRNILFFTTGSALVGFVLFPLMPPRLLCSCPFGSGTDGGFVDTLDKFGGLWRFGSHTMSAISNQYAAMPSLHFAWALWCSFALWPHVTKRAARAVVVLYPCVTLLVIIITANHFWLDAAGGALVLCAGWLTVTSWARFVQFRRRESSVQVMSILLPNRYRDPGERITGGLAEPCPATGKP